MSRRPQVSSAAWMIAAPPSCVATLSRQATASPPAALISSTTAWAGPASTPSPCKAPPGSLTTTLAPLAASSRAYSRPRPRPEPVITATRPSNLRSVTGVPRLVGWGSDRRPDRRAALGAQRRDGPAVDVGDAVLLRQLGVDE